MDERHRKEIEQALAAQDGPVRLILGLRPQPARMTRGGAPSPDAFDDRRSYRQALIDHTAEENGEALGALSARVEAMGLAVRIAPAAGMLVVEGAVPDVLRALADPDVGTAQIDTPLPPLRPQED
ncbi:hypothetical protein [Sagittula sp. S175]|uniref:hypothetical protein n=1 Tax=Sagittula sp. S175 TaxID=3415129 RepID=UPI003C7D54B6